jgi:hypothetical protein
MQNLREETRGQVTATEVDAIKEEQLMQLGPVIGRIYGSLRSRVKRHLSIMQRRGLIPPKPPSLRGVPTKIEFISMLTAAQRATRTAAITRTVQLAGSMMAVWPEARYSINATEVIKEFNDGVGGTSRILNSPQMIKKLIAQAAQEGAQAKALAVTQQGAAAAKDLSQANVQPGNALSALVGGQPGGQ